MLLDTAFTIEPMKVGKRLGISPEELSNRNLRLDVLKQALLKELIKHEPAMVSSESPFLGRFPQAYAALVECVFAERSALREYAPEKLLVMITPTTVKVGAGVAHNSNDKEDMREALENIPDVDLNGIKVDDLDEHAIDAVHVARAAISQAYGLLTPFVRKKKKKGKRKGKKVTVSKTNPAMTKDELIKVLKYCE